MSDESKIDNYNVDEILAQLNEDEGTAFKDIPVTPSRSARNKKKSTSDRKKKKVKKGKFKKGLIIYALILLVVIIAILVALWFVILNYSNNQKAADAAEAAAVEAERAPQKMFEEWYASMTPENWADIWIDANPETNDSTSEVVSYMKSVFSSPDITLYKGENYTDDVPVFAIWNSDSELADVSLERNDTEEVTSWSVADISINIGTSEKTITVPSDCTVTCGGIELSKADALPADSIFPDKSMLESLVNPVSWVTYTVNCLTPNPIFEISTNSEYAICTNDEGQNLLCLEDGKTYQDSADSFVRAYLSYYLQGKNNTYGNMYSALSYVASGSQAYENLTQSADGVSWNSSHSNINIGTEVGNVIVWADNCYSVDIIYAASGNVGKDNKLDEYDATMRVYFTENNGVFYITNYVTL